MPKYVLPKPKKKKKGNSDHAEVPSTSDDDMVWRRRLDSIPADQEILDNLEVGDKYEMLITGTVTGIDMHKRDNGDTRRSFDFDMDSVAIYPEGNEFADLVKDD